MSRFIAAATGLLLLLLGSQAVLAQYAPAGSLTLSTSSPPAGSTVTVAGTGFQPGSNVNVTIESTPQLLATVTTGASGDFSVDVTIPESFSGQHSLVATGMDPQGSVRVLASTIEISSGVLGTQGTPPPDTSPIRGSDGLILAIAAAGIVLLTGALFLVARRARAH